MSTIKSRVLAAFAVLALITGLGAAGASAAKAATPSCGTGCISIYPREYAGQSLGAPQFVTDVFRQGEKTGQPVILFRASNSDPAEDFTYSEQGDLSEFYAAGLVSPAVALHYGCTGSIAVANAQIPCGANSTDDEAYEIQYSPYGVDSGLCVGTATTAVSGTKVTLQPCGESAKTVWIMDTVNSPVAPYYAAINGSDTNFSDPFVMTYPSGKYPTDVPRAQLYTANLAGFQGGVTNDDSQLWTGFGGVLP